MAKKCTALTVGLEEELFLVEQGTGNLASNWPAEFSLACSNKYPDQIIHEFLACQVEIISQPHASIAELAKEYRQLRQHLSLAAADFGMAVFAASTHPIANWLEQVRSESSRYSKLEHDLQLPAKRMLVGGMHLHVGVEDKLKRLQLAQYLVQFLPLFLSLTTSSPFWQGVNSGLASSRMNVINALPRSGIPPTFNSFDEYQQYLNALISNGAIESAKEVWWDIRLNAKFPTVELRIADTCTLTDHTLAVAALYQCLAHHFLTHKQPISIQNNAYLNEENRWRSQRYVLNQVDYLTGEQSDISSVVGIVKQLMDELADDAAALGCIDYLMKLNDILDNGTSTDMQLDVYRQSFAQGRSHQHALHDVISWVTTQSREKQKKNSKKKEQIADRLVKQNILA